jgi:uncharacterized protein (TIGR00297 family)
LNPATIASLGNTGPRLLSLDHSNAMAAAVVAIGFAVLARFVGAVSDGGALVGIVIAFLLMVAAGLRGLLPLLAVLILTLLATRWRSERKRNLGVAERGGGRRASQVLANLGAAALCAAAVIVFPRHYGIVMVGAMAALAEAAADTVSSETGQAAASQARMILDFQPAPIGTNGAISLEGTFAGCMAALVVAWVSAYFGVVAGRWAPVIAVAGIAGMLFDSVLGATLENRRKIGNNSVNFVSTVFAADMAIIAAMILQGMRG